VYSGFKYVGKLPSIEKQRILQKDLLDNFNCSHKKFLQIGTGDGFEMEVLIQSNFFSHCNPTIYLCEVDLSYFSKSSLPNLSRYSGQSEEIVCSVEKIEEIFPAATLDIIQIGFVMHDIECPTEKDEAFASLFSILKPNGKLVFSDSFINNIPQNSEEYEKTRKNQVASLYDFFIKEADDCLKNGGLNKSEYELLLGDGKTAGLVKTKADAIRGVRDFYEEIGTTIARLRKAGFEIMSVIDNPVHDALKIIVAGK
jgi:ubiquinone/menaquinone biosynthesis C-methylase UbiE